MYHPLPIYIYMYTPRKYQRRDEEDAEEEEEEKKLEALADMVQLTPWTTIFWCWRLRKLIDGSTHRSAFFLSHIKWLRNLIVHIYIYICTDTYKTYTYTGTDADTYISIYMCIYARTVSCTTIYIYIYIYAHACMWFWTSWYIVRNHTPVQKISAAAKWSPNGDHYTRWPDAPCGGCEWVDCTCVMAYQAHTSWAQRTWTGTHTMQNSGLSHLVCTGCNTGWPWWSPSTCAVGVWVQSH